MDEALRDRIRRAAEESALVNALKHDSDAQVGALMGPLMAENPDFREHGDDIPELVAPVVDRVNAMDAAERRDRLAELAPEKLDVLETDDSGDDRALPDLPNADAYDGIRMRLAPNPNGPWHIGSARMPAVIGTYKELYDGWMCCRFDDTDPETKRPNLSAYDAILDAIEYLGFEPDDVVRASDRLEHYYEHARTLIDMGEAYTCSCPQGEFSDLKNDGVACEHRDKEPERVRREFDDMVDGEYEAGAMVLRVKTEIDHPNPALRDWVAFRMVDTPHPRSEAAEYRCWPLLDFQSGIDDHLLEITHIVRGIDLQDSAKRQAFVYDAFGWEYPDVLHWGHVQVDEYEVALSTSEIQSRIEAGDLEGWDDPRAPTIASLRRRGIRGEAIVDAMVALGTSTSNVDLAMSTIYATNRDLIDDGADRAFFVTDGVEKQIVGGPDTGTPPVHPDHPDRGTRDLSIAEGVIVPQADLPGNDERVWLKGYGPVRLTRGALEFTGEDIEIVREGDVDVIHWVPAAGAVPTRVRTMEGDETGVAEPGLQEYDADAMLQFERYGFVRVDRHDDEATVVYFAHS